MAVPPQGLIDSPQARLHDREPEGSRGLGGDRGTDATFAGGRIRVAPNVARGSEGSPDGLEFIAIGSDRPEGGDGEMVQEFWTD